MATRKISVQREQARGFDFDLELLGPERAAAAGGAVGTVEVGGEEFTIYRMTCSSEFPVERYDYRSGAAYLEILSHEPKAVDLSRFKSGAAVAATHFGDQIGVIEACEVLPNRKLQVDVRYGKDELSQLYEQGVRTRIRRNVSIRYITVGKPKLGTDEKTGLETRTFTRWQPIHMSHEVDGADYQVGLGRSREEQVQSEIEVEVPESTTREEERNTMTPEEQKVLDQAAQEATRKAVEVAVGNRNREAVEIRTLARNAGLEETAVDDLLNRGLSKSEAAIEIISQQKTPARAPVGSDPLRNLSKGERRDVQKRYSVARAIEQAVQVRAGVAPTGLEGEWHQRLLASSRRANEGALLVPWRTHTDEERAEQLEMRSRAMGTGLIGYGAELVYDAQPVDLLDALRPRLALSRMGANFMPGLRGPVPMPRFTSDAVLHWADEAPAAAVAETALGTDVSWLKEKTLAGQLPIPKQLLQTSNFDIENRIRRMLASAAAVKIDRAGLHGTGSEHQPLGLWSLPGVNTVDTSAAGDVPLYIDLVDMTTAIADDDADGSRMGFIMTPGLAGVFRKTLEFSAAGASKIWTGDNENGMIAGYRATATNVCSKTLGSGDDHGLFFGNWEMYNVGLFGDALEILADPFTLATKQQLVLHLFQMADCGTPVPEAFCIMTNAEIS